MRKVEALKIGDYTYHVTQMGAIQGRDTLARLIAVAGPIMGEENGAGLRHLKPADLQQLSDDMAKLTEVELPDGKRPLLSNIYDLHFVGRYDEMFEWLTFCIKINFASFFAKALAKLGGLVKGKAEPEAKSA